MRTRIEHSYLRLLLEFTMPAPTTGVLSSKKRKNVKDPSASSKRRAVAEDPSTDAMMSQIAELEVQISESRKYYNNIATLLSMLDVSENAQKPNLAVAVSLCRVFSRLIAGGNMTEASRAAENEKIIVAWLKERCQEYQTALVTIMREGDASAQVCASCPAVMSRDHSLMRCIQATALTLCMRLISERATHIPGADAQVWSSGLFKNVFEAVVEARGGQGLQSEFVEKFVKAYEDVRFYTFMQIS